MSEPVLNLLKGSVGSWLLCKRPVRQWNTVVECLGLSPAKSLCCLLSLLSKDVFCEFLSITNNNRAVSND